MQIFHVLSILGQENKGFYGSPFLPHKKKKKQDIKNLNCEIKSQKHEILKHNYELKIILSDKTTVVS